MNVESSITAQAKDSFQIFNAQYGMVTKQSERMLTLHSPGHSCGYSRVLSLPPSFSFTLCHYLGHTN